MGIYNVHAGHCPDGQGASGASGLLKESVEDRKVKDYLITNLKEQGHTVYDCTDDSNCTERQNLQRIVAKCNMHTVDKDISIHLNAGGGTGVEVFIVNPSLEYTAAKICAEISSFLGIKNRGVKYSNKLYVLNHTKAPALLIECCFVDNQTDYHKWNAKNCADAITTALIGKKPPISAWIKDNVGWWYRYSNGTYPVNQWLKLDHWYYFNAKGYALINEWLYKDDKWYYFNKDCHMVTGWYNVDGYWYYFNKTGHMLDGWQKVEDKWYYLDEDGEDRPHGAMVTGKITYEGHDYILSDNGDMLTGWYNDKGKWYYFNKDNNCQPIGSKMYSHWIDGYYIKDDGTMACGERLTIGEKDYIFELNGKVRK